MKKHLIVTAGLAVFCLMVAMNCGDDSVLSTGGGGGGGNGGGGINGPYELAPFRFHRHSVSIFGGRYGASVGMFGQAFFTQSWGNAFVPTGTRAPLADVWHTGSVDTMFMVGGHPFDDSAYILRFLNGERTSMPHPLRQVAAAVDGPAWNRLYAVGANGVIAEYRGGDYWTTFWVKDDVEFSDIWVSAPDTFWVSGGNGAVYHYNGSDLVDKSVGGIDPVWSIVGVSPELIYAAVGDEIYEIEASSAPRSVFVEPGGNDFYSIHASRPGWIVAVGQMGRVATFDGSVWDSQQLLTIDDLTAVWTGTIGAEVWGTEGAHFMYHAGWRTLCITDVKDWEDIHVYARNKAYGLLDGKLWAWDGDIPEWRLVTSVPDVHLGGLFAVGDNQVWAYDLPADIDRFAYYFSDSPRETYWIGSMDTPNDIFCGDQDQVVMVGPFGSTWRFNPGTSNFTPGSVGVSTKNLNGVWGYDWNIIYAVGDEGTIVKSVDGGENWSAMTSGVTDDLHDVWGWFSDRLVAVGDNGTVLIYNTPSAPNAWAPMSTGVTDDFHYVWTRDGEDIWVAGAGNEIMRYDGGGWTSYDNLPNVRIKGVSGHHSTLPIFVCDEDFVFQKVRSAE